MCQGIASIHSDIYCYPLPTPLPDILKTVKNCHSERSVGRASALRLESPRCYPAGTLREHCASLRWA